MKNIKYLLIGSAPYSMRQMIPFALSAAFLAFPGLVLGKVSSTDASFIDTVIPASIPAEIVADWKKKDGVTTEYSAAITEIKSHLPAKYASKLDTGSTEALYLAACHWRRVARIQPFSDEMKRILCARHYNVGGAMSGYLEDLNDDVAVVDSVKKITSSKGSRYKAGAAFLVLNFDNYYPAPSILLEDKTGLLRDPCVSLDAHRVAFAWSKDNNGYHIYEMGITKPDSSRQLTFNLPGLTVSDYEPCYVPNGDIIFNSSRCFQGHSFSTNLVSNLFIMNKDGKYVRRICFDQAHNFHPTLMSSGRIMFSRWEFNDRHPGYAFGVFVMNPDGALQNEYFGNQCSYPNTFPNAREIPDSRGKFLSLVGTVAASMYQGDVVLVDPAKGRNTIDAVELIAPIRDTYNSNFNTKSQDPYPMDETWFLISYADNPSTTAKYRLYLMDIDGNRELLAWDANQSISQPIPICEKKAPRIACQADYSKTTGEVTMSNAYYGMGIDSTIKPGTIKKIRVVALEYRMYPSIGNTGIQEYTPIARAPGCNESKRIIGEMKVESDGSAACIIPARTPFYVQLIDSNGCMIQSMRSWMTLQPGEKFACYGCHEDKNTTPPAGTPIAQTPKALDPFYDIVDGYLHYPVVIQPILDAKCVSCHVAGHVSGLDLSGEKIWTGDLKDGNQKVERFWCKSYINLTDPKKGLVSFISNLSAAEGQKPDTVGARHSKLISKLRQRSGGMADVALSETEMGKFCAWIDLCIPHGGKYNDDMTPADSLFYETRLLPRKQEDSLEAQNIAEFIKNGGYQSLDYGGMINGSIYQGKIPHLCNAAGDRNLEVRFSRLSRQLIMKLPAAGSVTIVDLKGRRMFTVNISNAEYVKGKGSALRAASVDLPSGLYIAQFKGTTLSQNRVVPVL